MEPCHERYANEDAAAMDNQWNETPENTQRSEQSKLAKIPYVRKIILTIQLMQHTTPDPLEAIKWEAMLKLAAYKTMDRTLIL